MSKQPKTTTPTDADLKGNPMIGGNRGTTAGGTTPDAVEENQGETTMEGDTENGTNAFGGIDKSDAPRGHKPKVSDPPRPERG